MILPPWYHLSKIDMLERKNIQDKKYILGQFFTPQNICNQFISSIDFSNALIIEPSFGTGNFLLSLKNLPNEKIGLELDSELFSNKLADTKTKLINQNFYDFTISIDKKLIFVGNPPYRTPAYSLTTHKDFISKLTKKHKVLGIREEAVFFILHTIDIISTNGRNGEIHYIVPSSLLKNNSKFFTRFKEFLKQECHFAKITSLKGTEFDGVAQDLIFLSLYVKSNANTNRIGVDQKYVVVDGQEVDLDDYLCLKDTDSIPFQKIFKKTYLGSVPCESLLMSAPNESREDFQRRIYSIIADKEITTERLYQCLQFNGRFHLKIFEGPHNSIAVQEKLKKIFSYVHNIQEKRGILKEFSKIDNYKEINVRKGVRYYFRCEKLKKGKNFVYELNPSPCRSFYFTGNPSYSSTDYFGFCEYDCNRNVSPGANRTIPIENFEENLTSFFKDWWYLNTDEPLSEVFNYIMFVAKTSWYKNMKRKNKRFYFSIPAKFISREQRYNQNTANFPANANLAPAHSAFSQSLF